MFTEKTQKLLEKAGWHPDYEGEVTAYQQLMEKEGCPLPPVVVQFLQKFGGLYVRYPSPYAPGKQTSFQLDGLKAADAYPGQYCIDLEHYSQRIGSTVYAVGDVKNHALLLMSEEGKFYLAFDGYLVFKAETGEAGIEALIHGHRGEEIP